MPATPLVVLMVLAPALVVVMVVMASAAALIITVMVVMGSAAALLIMIFVVMTASAITLIIVIVMMAPALAVMMMESATAARLLFFGLGKRLGNKRSHNGLGFQTDTGEHGSKLLIFHHG